MLIIGIIVIGANLRAPITEVGPLVNLICGSLHISNTLGGMITTLPLLAFAGFSLLTPILGRKFGTKLVLFWSLIFLTFGIILRSSFDVFGLFIGTAIIGLSISVGNVLIPSLIKHEIPERVGMMTGAYTLSMNLFGAMASGISIPVAAVLGWPGSLRIWAVLSLLSIILWIPQIIHKKQEMSVVEEPVDCNIETKLKESMKKKNEIKLVEEEVIKKVNLLKSPLAWHVTVYMGLQSMVFYCMVAWLPTILVNYGMNLGTAGWMLSIYQLAGIPMTFVGSVLAGRNKANQRPLVIVASLCVLVGLLGLLSGRTGLSLLWVIILGIGCVLTFCLSMIFFSFRTKNANEAARLSGMAQSIGYLLAAFGPTLLGFLHDMTNNWVLPLIILIGVAVLCLFAGLSASRDLTVGSNTHNRDI